MELRVLGAGQDVGRSCFLLTLGPHRLLLDVGAHHGFDDARRFPDFSSLPPGTLSSLTAVLISHFHFDHVAALPLLTELLACPAPVYMTAPTRHLARLLLKDVVATSAYRSQSCPYSTADVDASLSRALDLPVAKPVVLAPGLSVTAYVAGHALGAVMLHIQTPTRSLLYSGDYASRPDRHLRPARPPFRLRPDVFISETTYASAARAAADPAAPLSAAILAAVCRRAHILIPVSAFGRVPAILAALEACAGRPTLERVPLYVAAGLAWRALGTYANHAGHWASRTSSDNECTQCRASTVTPEQAVAAAGVARQSLCTQNPRRPRRSRFGDSETNTSQELSSNDKPSTSITIVSPSNNTENTNNSWNNDNSSEATNSPPTTGNTERESSGPCPHALLSRLKPFHRAEHWESVVRGPGPVVLFATPGGMSTGLSRDIAREWAGSPENLVVVPGTCFSTAIASDALNGVHRTAPVRCQLVNLSVQCHVDGPEILRMVRHVEPKCVVLVHGEKARTLGFRNRVTQELGVPCFAPANGDVLQLEDQLLDHGAKWLEAGREEPDGTVGDEDMDDEEENMSEEANGAEPMAKGDEWDKALAKYRQMIHDVR